MTIFWPGTNIARSTGNAFTAHERGDTVIAWAPAPSAKQLEQRAKALVKGRASTDAAYKRRGVDLAPKPQQFYSGAGMPAAKAKPPTRANGPEAA